VIIDLRSKHGLGMINETSALLGERHIFLHGLGLKTKSLSQFLDFVKNKIIVQRTILPSKGQMSKFYSVSKPFFYLLQQL